MEIKSVASTKKLYLSSKDKKLTGLCGGISEFFEIDSSVVRLAWIVITILTGVVPGIIAYFVASIVVPKKDEIEENHK